MMHTRDGAIHWTNDILRIGFDYILGKLNLWLVKTKEKSRLHTTNSLFAVFGLEIEGKFNYGEKN